MTSPPAPLPLGEGSELKRKLAEAEETLRQELEAVKAKGG